jgi:S-adenosyl methyltransferase
LGRNGYALSHITRDDADPGVVDEITTAHQDATASAVLRSAEEIAALFGGLELAGSPGRPDT